MSHDSGNRLWRKISHLFAIVFLLLLDGTNGFMFRNGPVVTNAFLNGRISERANSKLFAIASLDDESKDNIIPTNNEQEISWMNLPRNIGRTVKNDESSFNNRSTGLKAEILIGRIAMIGALYLISVEVVTGVSLPEQFQQLLVSLSL